MKFFMICRALVDGIGAKSAATAVMKREIKTRGAFKEDPHIKYYYV